MLKNQMNSRERMHAILEKQPVDRIPFWPKITKSYMSFQNAKWRNVSIPEVHSYIGSEYLSYAEIDVKCEFPAGIALERKRNGDEIRVIYRIGKSELIAASFTTKDAGDNHPTEYPVKTREDILLMTEFYDKIRYSASPEAVKSHLEDLEDNPNKLFVFSMPASPVMELVQYTMGIENFSYMMFDYPELVKELMAAIHRARLKLHELCCDLSPVEYFLSVENTSTTLISPLLFADYCVGHLRDYSTVMKKYGKKQILHMCGKLKAILPEIEKIPAIAMEAFTSPTTGDTYIRDGYEQLPTKSIIGGSCATTWAMSDPKAIADRILSDIRAAGGAKNLFLSSGGVIPFSANPELIRDVWERIKSGLYM